MEALKNKSYRTYDYVSRYTSFPYYYNVNDDKYMYGTTSQIDKDISYNTYQVEVGDTYDSIALSVYNSPLFYWVICDFNDIQNPFEDPQVGTVLRIPTLTAIRYKEL